MRNIKLSEQKKNGTFVFIPDEPITTEEEDAFGHSHHVDTLEEIIRTCETPCNVGLFGRWGVGKTSILNLLINRVREKEFLRSRFDIIRIDAWKFSKESLRQQILLELNSFYKVLDEEKIEDRLYNIREEELPTGRGFWSNVVNILRLFLVFFISLLGILVVFLFLRIPLTFDRTIEILFVPLLLQLIEKLYSASVTVRRSAKRIIPRIQSPHQFERLFNEILEKGKDPNKNLIVAIDNLDRCDDEVVVDMLRTIKTFMDLKGCIYLIPCDDEALIKHLRSVKGKEYTERDAREFLRKFFHTSITIPPFLDEKLDEFMGRVMKETKVPFGPSVKDVLIYATTNNPRRVKQFLNNMVALYSLAKSREEKGLIAPGTITKHTDFLAKIIVLRDEWPDFYRELSKRENLLEIAERRFGGEKIETIERLSKFYKETPDLEVFLRRTRTVTVPDIAPFLKLNQETFESTLPELDLLRLKVNEGDASHISEKLEGLTEHEIEDYFKEILKILENNARLGRFLPLFNNLYLLSEIFDRIPQDMKREVVGELEKSITLGEIKKNLRKFNIEKIFPILRDMRKIHRDQILMRYSELLQKEKALDFRVLDYLIANRDLLPPRVVNQINEAWISFYASNEPEALKVLREKFISANVRQMINRKTIASILEKIDDSVSENNKGRCGIYLDLRDVASSSNKSQFVRKMLRIAIKTGSATIDPNIQFALQRLMVLEIGDVPQEVFDDFYDTILKLTAQMTKPDHKIEFFKLAFKHFDRASGDRRSDLVGNHISPLIGSGGMGVITKILDTAKASGLNLLTLNPILTNLLNRIQKDLPDPNLINRVINESPKEQRSRIGDTLEYMIRSGNTTLYSRALDAFKQNHNQFSKSVINKICKASFEMGRGIQVGQKPRFFEPIVVAFKSCSDTFKNEFVDQVLLYILSNDMNERSIGVDYYSKVKEDVSEDKRLYVTRQVIQRLQSISESIDSNAKPLFNVIIEEQKILEEGEITDLIYVLTGQLNTAKSEEVQLIGLEYISKLQKLYRRSNQVLNAVFNLSRSSSAKVKESCKNLLKALRGYKGRKGFWKEVEKFFGEKVIE